MMRTRLRSYSTIRRGLAGLVNKLSIEPVALVDVADSQQQGVRFRVFPPGEVFARRAAAGRAPYPQELQAYKHDAAFCTTIERLSTYHDLSHREAGPLSTAHAGESETMRAE